MTRWAATAAALAAVATALCIAVVGGIAAAVVVVLSGGASSSVSTAAPAPAPAASAPAVLCPSGRVPDRLVVHHQAGVTAYLICTVGSTATGVVGVGDAAFVRGMVSACADSDGAVLVAIAVPGEPAVPLVFSASGLLDPPATAAAIGRARLGAVIVSGGRYVTPATVDVWAL